MSQFVNNNVCKRCGEKTNSLLLTCKRCLEHMYLVTAWGRSKEALAADRDLKLEVAYTEGDLQPHVAMPTEPFLAWCGVKITQKRKKRSRVERRQIPAHACQQCRKVLAEALSVAVG